MTEKITARLASDRNVLERIRGLEEVFWQNRAAEGFEKCRERLPVTEGDIAEAELLWKRFAPFISSAFPETAGAGGVIESPLREISAMSDRLSHELRAMPRVKMLLKMDSHLAVAGSVKARGGIYEVLKHTETLAQDAGLLRISDDYSKLNSPKFREFFSDYSIGVGSTGNLGLSIGITSAAIGYRTTVHMSADAKQWKKELLRRKGVTVVEYSADYCEAVRNGRICAGQKKNCYFVDDENSRNLFIGYSTAAGRLKKQLEAAGISVDKRHPLYVYIPCGIGGAPGGITFGLKAVFGDSVRCFFTEPTHACCMLAGMITGKHGDISVQNLGIDGITAADGLAVARPSSFVGKLMEPLLDGIFTISDERLDTITRLLYSSEGIFIEPSASAAFAPAVCGSEAFTRYMEENNGAGATHIFWATGGSLVPQAVRDKTLLGL